MDKTSDGCLCRVCDLKGCKVCPRDNAEEKVIADEKDNRAAILIDILLNILTGTIDANKLLKVGRAIEKIEELYEER